MKRLFKSTLYFIGLIFIANSQTIEIAKNDFIYCEIRCCAGQAIIDHSIKFIEEGLICNDPFINTKINSKNRTLFIKYNDLNTYAIFNLQNFLIRNDFFEYDSVYECDCASLGGELKTIVLRKGDKFKTIRYFECYNSQIDSIFFYMNLLIPREKSLKHFEIYGNNFTYTRDIKCITH